MSHPQRTTDRQQHAYVRRDGGDSSPGRWRLYAIAFFLMGAAAAAGDVAQADEIPQADLVFTSDDDASRNPGCDAHSVINARTGAVVARGERVVSTGRLAVAPDGSMVVSVANNSDSGGHIYVLRRDSGRSSGWTTHRIGSSIPLIGSPLAIAPDGEYFLFASRGGIDKHAVSDLQGGALRSRAGRFDAVRAGELLIAPDSRTAYVIAVDGNVHVLDMATMLPVGDPIPYTPVRRGDRRRLNTHATLSADGRYVLVNSGAAAGINVIDTEAWRSDFVDVDGVRETWDVAFNYADNHRGLVAVHGRDTVAVYRFAPPGGLELLTAERVPPQQFAAFGAIFPEDIHFARIGTLAWTGAGDGVVAAVGLKKEYRIFDLVEENGYRLQRRLDIDSCEHNEAWTLQLDVMTMNLLRPPTPNPTRTPTMSPVPTVTALSTATVASPTSSPTASVSPSPEPTPRPQQLFVPIALLERCDKGQQWQDAVLAIDTSSSMNELARGGGSKLEAAREAAHRFVSLLRLADGDRAAIVSFDAEAQAQVGLTSDRSALDRAIAGLSTGEQTCLPCAVSRASEVLREQNRREGSTPVIVVLTDGKSNPRPASEAVGEASRAKASGIVVFTIGLGEVLDLDALEAMASTPGFFYKAPDASDLVEIYERIAVERPCPTGRFWGRR